MGGSVHFSSFRTLIKKPCISCFPLLSKSSHRIELTASSVSSSRLFPGFGDGCRRRVLRVGCKKGVEAMLREEASENETSGDNVEKLACVMKFGGSSLASAERMREVTNLVLQFRDERLKAVSCSVSNASEIDDQSLIKVTHVGCCHDPNSGPPCPICGSSGVISPIEYIYFISFIFFSFVYSNCFI
ncbi:hypothetical protein AAG906_011409 [Vitis piasezkii]